MKRRSFPLFLLAALATGSRAQETPDASPPRIVRVFVLAGQSNMEGQGVVDLDHPQHYNGGRGTLERLFQDPRTRPLVAHLKDANGEWVRRADVLIRFQTKDELKKGELSIGFTAYGGRHHIGPELQFGHVVGDALEEPVLLIKTAWGGKSLHRDFRPPSAGGETGASYLEMLKEVDVALERIETDFPGLRDHRPEISGFVWFQGWNDMVDDRAVAEYEDNLVHLIHDVRTRFGLPALPVVIGELGNLGDEARGNLLAIRAAQRAAAAREEVGPHVRFVPTAPFARPAEDSPNTTHGHHWFGNAECYVRIGDALGRAMIELLARRRSG